MPRASQKPGRRPTALRQVDTDQLPRGSRGAWRVNSLPLKLGGGERERRLLDGKITPFLLHQPLYSDGELASRLEQPSSSFLLLLPAQGRRRRR